MGVEEESFGFIPPDYRKYAYHALSRALTLKRQLIYNNASDKSHLLSQLIRRMERNLNKLTDGEYGKCCIYGKRRYPYFSEIKEISGVLNLLKNMDPNSDIFIKTAESKFNHLIDLLMDLVWKLDNHPMSHKREAVNTVLFQTPDAAFKYKFLEGSKWTVSYQPKKHPSSPWEVKQDNLTMYVTDDIYESVFCKSKTCIPASQC